MRLFAAIVPPREVLDEVRRVVTSVNDPLPPEPQGRGLMRRLSSRGSHGGAHAAGRTSPPPSRQPATAQTTHELDASSRARCTSR